MNPTEMDKRRGVPTRHYLRSLFFVGFLCFSANEIACTHHLSLLTCIRRHNDIFRNNTTLFKNMSSFVLTVH